MSTADQQRRYRASKGARVGQGRGPAPTAACGTVSGYKGHKRRHEHRCDSCWAAWAAYQRDRYARRTAG